MRSQPIAWVILCGSIAACGGARGETSSSAADSLPDGSDTDGGNTLEEDGSSDGSDGATTAPIPGPSNPVVNDGMEGQLLQSFTDTVGSLVTIELGPQGTAIGGNCGADKPELDFTYDDVNNYFGGAPSLEIWYRLTEDPGGGTKEVSTTATMASDPELGVTGSQYLLVSCPDTANISEVTFAFANPAKTTWDSNNSQNYSVLLTPPKANPQASFDTVDGNHVDVVINLTPSGNTNCSGATLDLTYTDKTDFFSAAPAIFLWARFDAAGGSDETLTTTLALSNGSYTSTTVISCLDTLETTAPTIELAFANLAKTKWDSNNSQNYVVHPR